MTAAAEASPTDICPKCGDVLAWCPDYPEFHQSREDV